MTKIDTTQKLKFCVSKVQKHGGKRRKGCLPAFSPPPQNVSKTVLHWVVKSLDCVVKI